MNRLMHPTKKWERFLSHSVGQVHGSKLYIVRGKKYRHCLNSMDWWFEPVRHARKTLDGALIAANNGACMKDRYMQLFEIDLDRQTVKKLWQGYISSDAERRQPCLVP